MSVFNDGSDEMVFNELIESIEIVERGGDANPDITDVVYDSRLAMPGSLFVAIPGCKTDGDSFVKQAIKNGAVAVVSQKKLAESDTVWVQVPDARKAVGLLAQRLWQVSLEAMTSVGITGTNGKTTTATLFYTFFQTLFGNDYAWLFSTIVYRMGATIIDAARTTPEAADICRSIGKAAQRPRAVVMEVSSHSLALSRVEGIEYDCALWTNLTQDHLDFHETMEAYYEAKKLLFTRHLKKNGVAVVNVDDPWGRRLHDEIREMRRCITYGRAEDADLCITGSRCTLSDTEITLRYRGKEFTVRAALAGEFNVYNISGFVAGCLGLGYQIDQIEQALNAMTTVPGRMEIVPVTTGFSVVVDYAHTPDALVNVLQTVRKLTDKNVICVFGCGGERDKTKRPRMAEAVVNNCDEAIVTSDNPRSEKPHAIIVDILEGIPLDFPHTVIHDRREAIKKSLLIAQPGDIIVIAGKGHETYQEIGSVRHHFSDREVVLELCQEMELSGGKQ